MRRAALLFSGVLACSDAGKERPPIATDATLALVREKKLTALLGPGTWEASGIALEDGKLRVVFDNGTRVGYVATDLGTGTVSAGEEKSSQWEAITTDGKRTFVAVEGATGVILELDDAGAVVATFTTDLTFADPNKGLEGLAWATQDAKEYLFAMGEADGSIAVLVRNGAKWTTEAKLERPAAAAAFADFSDIALRARPDGAWDAAITTQKSGALWLGRLEAAPWRWSGRGTTYGFPLASDGTVKYCNVEGVTFLDEKTLAIASDKADKNDDGCHDEDQSVHLFTIP